MGFNGIKNESAESRKRVTDYRNKQASPKAMIVDGRYVAGWFESFDGRINVQDAGAGAGRLSSWLHVTFDTPTHFVGAHLADLSIAGHAAVLIVDKAKEKAWDRSKKSILWKKRMRIDEHFSRFEELRSGSMIAMTPEGGVELDVKVAGLRLTAKAVPAFCAPFVQTTRQPGAKGSLQWWGNLQLVEGTAIKDGKRIDLPAGVLGAYDRTVGHRASIQNWNWLSASGMATSLKSGEEVPFSMQMSKDGPRARPPVDGHKTTTWIGDSTMLKLPPITFSYERVGANNETGPWSIKSKDSEKSGMELTFVPRFKRREMGAIPLVYQSDFNQYYGHLSGDFWTPDGRYRISDVFALTEDSYLRF